MIKVLLLDDEQLALEYLESIVDWQRHGFEIIGKLTDARQALKVFRRERPDLIVSDIYMAGMDGLDFATSVRDIDQSVHILFLSSYKNFEYVQKAIRLDIDDYLLKSDITDEVFLKKLIQIRNKIERERQKKRYTTSVVFREIFSLSAEEKQYKDILSMEEYERLFRRYSFLICSVRHCPSFLTDYLPGVDEKWYIDDGTVSRYITDVAECSGVTSVAHLKIGETRMLSILDIGQGPASEGEGFERFHRAVRKIFEALNGAHSPGYDLFYVRKRYTVAEFGRLYRGSQAQMDRCFLHGEPKLYEFHTEPRRAEDAAELKKFTTNRICRAIEKADTSCLDEFVQAIRATVKREDFESYLHLMRRAFETFAYVEGVHTLDSSGRYFRTAEFSGNYNFFDPEDAIRFVRYKLDEALKLYQCDSDRVYSKSIREAISYLQDNYGEEDLGVNMVAKRVNLSVSWLSAKFKEEVGMGISEYLNSIRVQHARELLRNGDNMIYEVSEQTGFASSQYFSKIFKQFTGMTPNEYRRMNKNKPRE